LDYSLFTKILNNLSK